MLGIGDLSGDIVPALTEQTVCEEETNGQQSTIQSKEGDAQYSENTEESHITQPRGF